MLWIPECLVKGVSKAVLINNVWEYTDHCAILEYTDQCAIRSRDQCAIRPIQSDQYRPMCNTIQRPTCNTMCNTNVQYQCTIPMCNTIRPMCNTIRPIQTNVQSDPETNVQSDPETNVQSDPEKWPTVIVSHTFFRTTSTNICDTEPPYLTYMYISSVICDTTCKYETEHYQKYISLRPISPQPSLIIYL